jgi:hypothetical protein
MNVEVVIEESNRAAENNKRTEQLNRLKKSKAIPVAGSGGL